MIEAVLQTLNRLHLDYSVVNSSTSNDVSAAGSQVEDEHMETAEKLRVFNLLPTIASSLGAEDTRNKLIPIIEGLINRGIENGDDEALMVIAQKLKEFVVLVGGKDHAACLLPLLGRVICGVEEIVVVQTACDSLGEIMTQMPQNVLESQCLTLLRSIYDDDLYCASRKAGTKLLTIAYQTVSNDHKTEFKNRLIQLAANEDEIPLVRSAAVAQLADLIKAGGSLIKTDIIQILPNLVTDNQRIVRAACVRPLVELSKLLTDREMDATLLPFIDKLVEDNNRDTRRGLAASIAELQQTAVKFGRSLHTQMLRLLEDNETEVRKVSTQQLKGFCAACSTEVVSEHILPKLREHLNVEEDERVKGALVESVVQLMPTLRREECVPLVQQILVFLNDTNAQTKQFVFDHFSDLVSLIPQNELQTTILPCMLKLYQDKNWRVRFGVVSSTPLLLPHLNENTIKDTVLPACLTWLCDHANDTREASCTTLASIIKLYPNLADQLHKAGTFRNYAEASDYHVRQTWLLAVQTLCANHCKHLMPQFLPQLLMLANDNTPNVRICLAKALSQLKPVLDKNMLQKEVLPCLKRLANDDSDIDVKFFAQKALDSLSS